MTLQPPDQAESRDLFAALGLSLITVSIQPESDQAVIPRGRWFSTKNRVRALTLEDYYSSAFQDELKAVQIYGCAVYFMINQGDGVPKEPETGNLNCGRNENVTSLRTLCIDTDSGDWEKLKDKLSEIDLVPHYVVESSPGKYHLYFIIEPESTGDADALRKWKTLQGYLSTLVDGLDGSVTKQCQVLRIPGFYNLKPGRDPWKVRITKKLEFPKYNLHFLYTKLNGKAYEELIVEGRIEVNGEERTYTKWVEPEGYLKEGGRRKGITSYIEHLMENQIKLDADEEVYFAAMDAFIRKKINPSEQGVFLEEGSRRENLKSYIRDQIKWRIKKNIQYEKLIEHHESVKNETLPDAFYLGFPGDLGEITREIHNYAPAISLEMCFAGALIVSGMLKGDCFRLQGAWPYVNGIVIAGPGAGKSTIRTLVEKMLDVGGFRGRYPKLLKKQNTVQSLHTALYGAGGAGCMLVDEAGEYLQTITAKNAPGYAKALRSYFKDATTGRYEGVSLHPGESLSYRVPMLTGGLMIWLMIQPGVFEQTINSDDMADGFLPRFFIFNGRSDVGIDADRHEDKPYCVSQDLLVLMEGYKSVYGSVDYKKIEAEVDRELSGKKVKEGERLSEIRDRVYEARYQQRVMCSVTVEVEFGAQSEINAYMSAQAKELKGIVELEGESAASAPVYFRLREMLYRLMCNACLYRNGRAVVTREIAEKCIEFQKFQMGRFFAKELQELSKSRSQKEEEVVIKALKKAYREKGGPVGLAEILRKIAARNRPFNTRKTVMDLVAAKEIWAIERAHKHSKGTVKEYVPVGDE